MNMQEQAALELLWYMFFLWSQELRDLAFRKKLIDMAGVEHWHIFKQLPV